jgi:hypothetical protein
MPVCEKSASHCRRCYLCYKNCYVPTYLALWRFYAGPLWPPQLAVPCLLPPSDLGICLFRSRLSPSYIHIHPVCFLHPVIYIEVGASYDPGVPDHLASHSLFLWQEACHSTSLLIIYRLAVAVLSLVFMDRLSSAVMWGGGVLVKHG